MHVQLLTAQAKQEYHENPQKTITDEDKIRADVVATRPKAQESPRQSTQQKALKKLRSLCTVVASSWARIDLEKQQKKQKPSPQWGDGLHKQSSRHSVMMQTCLIGTMVGWICHLLTQDIDMPNLYTRTCRKSRTMAFPLNFGHESLSMVWKHSFCLPR